MNHVADARPECLRTYRQGREKERFPVIKERLVSRPDVRCQRVSFSFGESSLGASFLVVVWRALSWISKEKRR